MWIVGGVIPFLLGPITGPAPFPSLCPISIYRMPGIHILMPFLLHSIILMLPKHCASIFWLSSFFFPLLLSVGIFPFFHSDYSCVYLKFSLPDGVRCGRCVWKFNMAHLKDFHFIVLITQFWESWRAEKWSFSSLCSWLGRREGAS